MLYLDYFLAVTFRTKPRYTLTFSTAVIACHLYIGEHPRKDLVSLNNNPASFTVVAIMYVRFRVSSGTVAVITDNFARYLELVLY